MSSLVDTDLRLPSGDSGLGEISEVTDDVTDRRERQPAPSTPPSAHPSSFSVNLDGVDWFLTTLLITIDALLLELHRTRNAQWATFLTWFGDPTCDSSWLCKLTETIFLLAVAIVNVLLLVPIININIRTPSRASWRFWLLSAWASLILLNTMVVMQFTHSVMKAIDNDDDIDYWVSHFFLVATVTILTALLDVRFVMLYGLGTCLTCYEEETLQMWNGLRVVAGLPLKTDKVHLRDVFHLRRIVDRTMYQKERLTWRKGQNRTTFKFVKDAREGVERYVRRRRLHAMRHALSKRVTAQITDMPSEDVQQYLDEIYDSQTCFYCSVIRHKLMSHWDAVSQEPGLFEYSSWMKAAIAFTILILIYNCIKAMEMIFAFDSAWDVGHEAVGQLHSGLDQMHNATRSFQEGLEGMAGESTEELYSDFLTGMDSLDSALASFLPDGVSNSTGYRRASAMLHVVLIRASRTIESPDFSPDKVISAIDYADSLIRWLKYACLVGYPTGTCIGLYSLYHVMRQHKDMSMGLAREQQVRSNLVMRKAGASKLELRESLLGLEGKYPIGGAVYFIGVLTSTAVVQQHIFGMCGTMGIAVFLNIAKFDVLLNCGGYVALIYIGIIIVNYLCSHLIGDRLLTQQGFRIQYPTSFFLFLAVFTMVHAVLGFFYALWRALLLFVTTIWVINRLDISLFQTGHRLDNGHYSFMSMLLLTHVIRLENEARVRAGDASTPLRHASVSAEQFLSAAPSTPPKE